MKSNDERFKLSQIECWEYYNLIVLNKQTRNKNKQTINMPTFTKAMLEKLGLTPAATPLQAVPQKEKGKAASANSDTTVYHKNAVHQADLIFLPDKVTNRTEPSVLHTMSISL
jgi:hypothetical protein